MKNVFRALLLILLTLTLPACGKTAAPDAPAAATPDFVLAADGASEFVIIRPDVATPEEIAVAVRLKQLLSETTGANVPLKDDFIRAGTDFTESEHEILVGRTNRAESVRASEGLKIGDYRIVQDGTKLVIAFGSADAGTEALEWFAANCLFPDSGTAGVTAGLDHSFRTEYPLETITIAGFDVSEYTVVGSDAFTAAVRDRIAALTGVAVRTEQTVSPKTKRAIRSGVIEGLGAFEAGVRTVGADLVAGTSGAVCEPEEALALLCSLLDGCRGTISAPVNVTEHIPTDAETDPAFPAAKASSPFSDGRILVACWGDSITASMTGKAKSYPTRLQEMLGDRYRVLNGGDSGENTITIAARQGAYKVRLKNEVTFAAGETSVYVGGEDDVILYTEGGRPVKLRSGLGFDLPVNPVTIGGAKYTIAFTDFEWSPISYKMYLKRADGSAAVTLPADSEVVFSNTYVAAFSDVDVYCVGAGGGYDNTVEGYVAMVKAMIRHHGSERYLVIVPYWNTRFDEALAREFGDRAINYREEALKNGLAAENLTATADDEAAIAKNLVPASLHRNNDVDDVHLNEYGNHFLAALVYERGKALGFFEGK